MGSYIKVVERQHLRQQFRYCKNLSWDDIVYAISMGYTNESLSFLMSHNLEELPCEDGSVNYGFSDGKLSTDTKISPPTFGLHSSAPWLPGHPSKLVGIAAKVHRKWNIDVEDMQIFVSLGADASTYKRHKDKSDVLLVQAIGIMNYYVEGIGPIEFKPGDGIIIPRGVYHTPYVLEPRATLSFRW